MRSQNKFTGLDERWGHRYLHLDSIKTGIRARDKFKDYHVNFGITRMAIRT
jgi:hypothetical protein